MSDDRCVVREIAWRDLFPWLILFRTVRLAVRPSLLLAGALGALLTPVGWYAARTLFVPSEAAVAQKHFEHVVKSHWAFAMGDQPTGDTFAAAFLDATGGFVWGLIEPFRQLFDADLPIAHFAYFLFGGLWTLLVWALVGGVITRVAVVQLGREARIGLMDAVHFAVRRLGHYFTAPLMPLLGVVALAAPAMLLGLLLMRWCDFGVLVAGLGWVLILLLALASAFLLLGALFGWPLMWVAISCEERQDAFEGLQRSYAYTFSRPLNYLFYAALTLVLGFLGWLLVWGFSAAVVELSYWGVSWGAGAERLHEIQSAIAAAPEAAAKDVLADAPTQESLSWSMWAGGGLIAFWVALVRLIAAGFVYSFFWCGAAGIYLLLRHDVDETEFDEVYLSEEEDSQPLPPLAPDGAGVPELADQPRRESTEADASEKPQARGAAAEPDAPSPGGD